MCGGGGGGRTCIQNMGGGKGRQGVGSGTRYGLPVQIVTRGHRPQQIRVPRTSLDELQCDGEVTNDGRSSQVESFLITILVSMLVTG